MVIRNVSSDVFFVADRIDAFFIADRTDVFTSLSGLTTPTPLTKSGCLWFLLCVALFVLLSSTSGSVCSSTFGGASSVHPESLRWETFDDDDGMVWC
jgi:hypothetical protein